MAINTISNKWINVISLNLVYIELYASKCNNGQNF